MGGLSLWGSYGKKIWDVYHLIPSNIWIRLVPFVCFWWDLVGHVRSDQHAQFRNPKRGMALSASKGRYPIFCFSFLGLLCYRLALAGMVGTGVLQEYGMQYVTSDSNFVYQLINYTLIFF